MKEYYVNDDGNNATVVIDGGSIIVYTDLSAIEKKYKTLDDARHDLFVSGYYMRDKA